jgi:hypothetical protein
MMGVSNYYRLPDIAQEEAQIATNKSNAASTLSITKLSSRLLPVNP